MFESPLLINDLLRIIVSMNIWYQLVLSPWPSMVHHTDIIVLAGRALRQYRPAVNQTRVSDFRLIRNGIKNDDIRNRVKNRRATNSLFPEATDNLRHDSTKLFGGISDFVINHFINNRCSWYDSASRYSGPAKCIGG